MGCFTGGGIYGMSANHHIQRGSGISANRYMKPGGGIYGPPSLLFRGRVNVEGAKSAFPGVFPSDSI